MLRFRRWLRYRRALDRAVSARLDMGYSVSPPAYQRMQEQARAEAQQETPAARLRRQARRDTAP